MAVLYKCILMEILLSYILRFVHFNLDYLLFHLYLARHLSHSIIYHASLCTLDNESTHQTDGYPRAYFSSGKNTKAITDVNGTFDRLRFAFGALHTPIQLHINRAVKCETG